MFIQPPQNGNYATRGALRHDGAVVPCTAVERVAMADITTLGATEEFSAQLIEALMFNSVVLRATFPIVSSASEVHVPVVLPGSASFVDAGEDIGDAGVQGEFVTLIPKKVANLAVIPSETIEDASIDLGSAVGVKMLRAIGLAIDAALLKGAVNGPAGVLNFPHLPSISGDVSYTTLVDAAAAVREAGGNPEYAIISPQSLTDLQKETDGFSRPLIQPDPQGGPSYRVAGLELLVSPALDAGEGLVLDSSQFPTTLRRDPSLEVDRSFAFGKDSVALRATARVDGTVADVNGFCAIVPS
jgi:HK97 family phage major capsid protein